MHRFGRRHILFSFSFIAIASYLYIHFTKHKYDDLHQIEVSSNDMYLFKDVIGPAEQSVIPPAVPASWTKYGDDNPSAMAVLLTDTSGNWEGLVHGLKNIGIPFTITTKVSEAVKHNAVLVYPIISGKVLSGPDMRALAAIPQSGGTLIGVNVVGGGLGGVFGFDSVVTSDKRYSLKLSSAIKGLTESFSGEEPVRLMNPEEVFPTNGYTKSAMPVLSYLQDGTAFMTYKDYGKGKAYALGFDIGTYFLKFMNGRGNNSHIIYANHYDPGMDVLLRALKQIYINASSSSVTLGTVPFNKSLSLVITHDVDFTRSMENNIKYARMEKEMGVSATYFVQTKYIKDWNDDIFFAQKAEPILTELKNEGMEIASHSVSHSRGFAKIPLGDGTEKYPDYRPFVQNKLLTYNATILGELRVSKFLLETLLPDVKITSFRPGHLEHPFTLPEALMATKYSYSSSVTANSVQTHLPFMTMYNTDYKSETGIVEIPITIEDEIGLPLLSRLDSTLAIAGQLSKYGGVMNVLIHTDITGQKFEFEQKLITALKPKAWTGTIKDLGRWWAVRNQIVIKVKGDGGTYEIAVTNPSAESIQGLCLQIPHTWKMSDNDGSVSQESNAIILKNMAGNTTKIIRLKN